MEFFDVIVVGGGPAGLSAALVLGRCRRKIAVFDTGRQRNRRANTQNGFLTRDGIKPAEFLELAHNDVRQYDVRIIQHEVTKVTKTNNHFKVWDHTGASYSCRKILIATGLVDNIPFIPGIDAFYGISVHHCPYCDGWENRDKRLVAYGRSRGAVLLALALKNWSNDVILCTNGPSSTALHMHERLKRENIPVYVQRIVKLEGKDGYLKRITLKDGTVVERDALFFSTGYRQHCDIPLQLGCKITSKRDVWVNKMHQSSIEGVYVSGDAAYEMKQVIIAAGEGAKAGIAINLALLAEEGRR